MERARAAFEAERTASDVYGAALDALLKAKAKGAQRYRTADDAVVKARRALARAEGLRKRADRVEARAGAALEACG